MAPGTPFAELLTRIRTGDQAAARDLVHAYEPQLRRRVRLRLTDPELRSAFDSCDICQSVLLKFFTNVVSGQIQVETPHQMLQLLTVMARNKLIDRFRGEQPALAKRDRRSERSVVEQVADPAFGPEEICSRDELLQEFFNHLTPNQRRIAKARMEGQTWAQIAQELESQPDAVRKEFSRACDRAADELDRDS